MEKFHIRQQDLVIALYELIQFLAGLALSLKDNESQGIAAVPIVGVDNQNVIAWWNRGAAKPIFAAVIERHFLREFPLANRKSEATYIASVHNHVPVVGRA